MSRTIKFRIWSPREKKMYGVFDLYKDGSLMSQTGLPLHVAPLTSFVFMQFTGVFDKNGVEIYQGDILRITADKEGYGSTSYGGFAEVTSSTCGFSFRVFNPTLEEVDLYFDSSSLWHVRNPDNIEVIGNIYESPELLKEK